MTKVIATVVNAAGKTVNATMSVRPETVYTSDNITTVPAPVRGDADDKGRIEVEVDASHGGRWAIVLNVAGVWAREVRGGGAAGLRRRAGDLSVGMERRQYTRSWQSRWWRRPGQCWQDHR